MSKKQFALDDLYNTGSSPEEKSTPAKERKKPGPKTREVQRSPHFFRIDDEIWEDFLIYVQMRGGNQNNVVNDLFRETVEAHKEKIDKFKDLMG
ncbi:MAG: hypothetical protein NC132_06510 [Corallococcus sp.]|nr:hypothetical protein [Corallococcus sp.]MCM1395736.1 hypothetical protein [Corallococcus sp.]